MMCKACLYTLYKVVMSITYETKVCSDMQVRLFPCNK